MRLLYNCPFVWLSEMIGLSDFPKTRQKEIIFNDDKITRKILKSARSEVHECMLSKCTTNNIQSYNLVALLTYNFFHAI